MLTNIRITLNVRQTAPAPFGAGLQVRRITFPTFEISSNPEIPLTQIRERRFDLIERAQTLASAQVEAENNRQVFEVLDRIAQDAAEEAERLDNAMREATPPRLELTRPYAGPPERADIRLLLNGEPVGRVTSFRPTHRPMRQISNRSAGIEPVYQDRYLRNSRLSPDELIHLDVDYSQMEMRAMAQVDPHSELADQITSGRYNTLSMGARVDPDIEALAEAYRQLYGQMNRVERRNRESAARSQVRDPSAGNRAQRRARLRHQGSQRERRRVPTPPRWLNMVPPDLRARQEQVGRDVHRHGVRLQRGGSVRHGDSTSRNRGRARRRRRR